MHILIIPSERYASRDAPLEGIFQQHQAQALARAGYKVGVISPPELRSLRLLGEGLSGRLTTGIRVENEQGIPVLKYYGWCWIPRIPNAQMWLRLRAWMALFRKYVTQYGIPEIIHAHNSRFAGLVASKIKKKWHIPYILTEHSSLYGRGLVPDSHMRYVKEVLRNADKYIAVSPFLKHVLEGVFGNLGISWECVPNVLDIAFETNTVLDRTLNRSNNSFRFLNIGIMTDIKGQEDLLRGFAIKFEGKNDIQLRLGGDGPFRKKLELLSTELRINKQVVFLGELNREQVLAEMQGCDVFVLASYYETFGVVLIEALSCGKPVIATACGGPEFIVREENGLLVSPRNIAALGEAMVVMREKINSYDPILIRNDCIARFGEQVVVSKLSNIYHKIHTKKEFQT